IAALLCAVAVVGSFLSFPVLGSRCAPVQHMVNVLCAVLLGPFYGVGVAFAASLLRNILGLGSLMAFPGSMFGALLCGIAFWKTEKLIPTLLGEVFGTAVLGGLCAYPIGVAFMGVNAANVAFYAYIVPFLISTAAGAIIAGIIVAALSKTGVLSKIKK
ncbi:MAG: energy coupling factor transporter S component ThiW, partial [Clostridia bacterium]|nr:energy coupling factor transporter S component ThiW [Clostridia bacterium]